MGACMHTWRVHRRMPLAMPAMDDGRTFWCGARRFPCALLKGCLTSWQSLRGCVRVHRVLDDYGRESVYLHDAMHAHACNFQALHEKGPRARMRAVPGHHPIMALP